MRYFVSAFVILISCAIPASAQQCEDCGDVNGDGLVNASDLTYMVQSLHGTPQSCEHDFGPPEIDYRNVDGQSIFGSFASAFNVADIVHLRDVIFGGQPMPTVIDCQTITAGPEVPGNQIQISADFHTDDYTFWQIAILNNIPVDGMLLTFDCDPRITEVSALEFPATILPDAGAGCQATVFAGDDQIMVSWLPSDGSQIPLQTEAQFLMRIKVPRLGDPVHDLTLNNSAGARTSLFVGPPAVGRQDRALAVPVQTTGIPTLTEWGLIILSLLLLVAITVTFVRKRRAGALA